MDKHKIIDALPWIGLAILMILMWLAMTGCSLYSPGVNKEGVTWKKGAIRGKPAKNKPVFVTRASYRTEEEFIKALFEKIAWLEGKNCEITLINPVYGKDMTQREVIKYFIIYHKEVKNGS